MLRRSRTLYMVVALAVLVAPAARAGEADGGTIRAGGGVYVPKKLQERRAEPSPADEATMLALVPPDVAAVLGDFKPEIGAWAEYLITEHKHLTGRVLVSVLPPPMPEGRYWLEIDSTNEESLPVALRLLAHGNPSTANAVERAIVYIAGQNMIELPMQVKGEDKPASEAKPSGAKITTVRETIAVRAGKFKAEKITLRKGKGTSTVWRSADVPLFGLVKSEGAGRVTELSASGHSGAHSLIATEIDDEAIPPDAKEKKAAPAQGNGSDNK